MTPRVERDFWLRWLKKYKSHRCLWDINSKDYSNQIKRSDAYTALLHSLQKIKPDADQKWVKARIGAFRNIYKKEWRRVQAAKESGIERETTLFYYDLLDSFLSPNRAGEVISEDEEEDSVKESDNESNVTTHDDFEWHTGISGDEKDPLASSQNKTTKSEFHQEFEDYLDSASMSAKKKRYSENNSIKTPSNKIPPQKSTGEDEYSSSDSESKLEVNLIGERLSLHFRNMTAEQRLIAEKLISDVCIFGRMDKLTMDTKVNSISTSMNKIERIDFG